MGHVQKASVSRYSDIPHTHALTAKKAIILSIDKFDIVKSALHLRKRQNVKTMSDFLQLTQPPPPLLLLLLLLLSAQQKYLIEPDKLDSRRREYFETQSSKTKSVIHSLLSPSHSLTSQCATAFTQIDICM